MIIAFFLSVLFLDFASISLIFACLANQSTAIANISIFLIANMNFQLSISSKAKFISCFEFFVSWMFNLVLQDGKMLSCSKANFSVLYYSIFPFYRVCFSSYFSLFSSLF